MLALCQFVFAQQVIMNRVEKLHDNTDKFLYRIDPQITKAEYLGELEVQGFSHDDVAVFGKIYAKAKEIGANAFSLKPFESIDGSKQDFDASNYRLSLYYTTPADFPKEDNIIYLISSPNTKQTIAVNKKNIVFEPRTFTKMQLEPGVTYTISTRKLLGTSIRLAAQAQQPVQYFQFSAFSVNSNPGDVGIQLKSGDIMRLERSYAQFLTTIYEFKP